MFVSLKSTFFRALLCCALMSCTTKHAKVADLSCQHLGDAARGEHYLQYDLSVKYPCWLYGCSNKFEYTSPSAPVLSKVHVWAEEFYVWFRSKSRPPLGCLPGFLRSAQIKCFFENCICKLFGTQFVVIIDYTARKIKSYYIWIWKQTRDYFRCRTQCLVSMLCGWPSAKPAWDSRAQNVNIGVGQSALLLSFEPRGSQPIRCASVPAPTTNH